MKVWTASCTAAILLSLASYCGAAKFGAAAKTFRNSLIGYATADKGLGIPNAALGMFSRSLTVGTTMQEMRQEEQAEMSYSLQMTVSTLAVLDVAGGTLLPIAQGIVDDMLENALFDATQEAFNVGEGSPQLQSFLDNPSDGNAQRSAKEFLKGKKTKIKATMAKDIKKLGGASKMRPGDRELLRKITKVKKIFKVQAVGKALGPVFDLINIGFSTDSLVRTSIDCYNGEPCHVGGLVSASVSIVSGIVGIVSVFVPVLAPLALLLGIAATLIEIFWQPPPPPPENLHLEERRFHLNAGRMREMDVFSRMQLQLSKSFLHDGGVAGVDLYVVNQGHFPNWMEENISEPEKALSGPITFGFNEKDEYDEYGVYKETIKVAGQCTNLEESFPERSGNPTRRNEPSCDYYQEGNGDIILNSRLEIIKGKLYVGPDFYGVSKSEAQSSTYGGAMILVPTDKVTDRELVGEEGADTYTTPVRIRGLNIDTEKKFVGKIAHTSRNQYNDIVAIGDMSNLGYKFQDGGHKVIINTGNSGRDVLVIDGWVKRLEARLGSNHNTLSFRTISKSKQKERRESDDESKKKNEIKGIKFNPGSGQLIMLGYDADDSKHVVEHELGHVRGVGILAASPFQDEITLFALQKDETNRADHFTVFKYNGTASYVFDANAYKSGRFGDAEVVHFKILDGSRDYTPDSPPLLNIINMHYNAKEQDVQYMNEMIHIYSYSREGTRREIARITFATRIQSPAKVIASKEEGEVLFPTRSIKYLDVKEYTGQRFDYDFTNRINAESRDHIVYLHCPKKIEGRGKVTGISTVVVSDVFFDECAIDDSAGDIRVKWHATKQRMYWHFPQSAKIEFSDFQAQSNPEFNGVERIVNEYGKPIIDLRGKRDFDLYDVYLKSKGEDMVKESHFGDEVKDNLNMCILKKTNLAMMQRNNMPRPTEFTANDIVNDCED